MLDFGFWFIEVHGEEEEPFSESIIKLVAEDLFLEFDEFAESCNGVVSAVSERFVGIILVLGDGEGLSNSFDEEGAVETEVFFGC